MAFAPIRSYGFWFGMYTWGNQRSPVCGVGGVDPQFQVGSCGGNFSCVHKRLILDDKGNTIVVFRLAGSDHILAGMSPLGRSDLPLPGPLQVSRCLPA